MHVTTRSAIMAEKFDQQKCRQAVVAMVVEMEAFVSAYGPQSFPSLYECLSAKMGHSGEVIANTVAKCLEDWGLDNVLTVTVDNAPSNDHGIDILKKRLRLRNTFVLNGDHFHARCCAHYVTASANRELAFLDCAKTVQVEYKGSVILDVGTRWNLTHDMLKAALKLEKAFAELDATDSKYRKELEKRQGESEPTKYVGQIGNPNYYYGQFLQSTLQSIDIVNPSGFKSELLKYFNDELEEDSPNFVILNYWKVHSSQLSILANIVRDLLVIPVSKVAYESAFSTGGQVLDEYRSRLSTQIVEALICTEDWLGGSPTSLPTQEDTEDLEKIE
ncbi:HAT family dimerization domain-containing protein [Trifolium pratense]|uniref:HAT family dimerization domain-containing protein n=1 Tax=Trifolium pratense TaxID=57577 RepID=A0A2K3MNJ0_TRIPR|nr:HAT family dimerization domain-containing protein [Trifolium pratense]